MNETPMPEPPTEQPPLPLRFEDEFPSVFRILEDYCQGRLIPPEPLHWTVDSKGAIVERDMSQSPGFQAIRVTPPPVFERNEPCICGSGKKWKKCHGRPEPQT